MKQKTTGKINIWKWLFLLLLAAVLGFGMILLNRITTFREDTSQIVIKKEGETKIGTFITTRDQLNDTVATYLKDYQRMDFSYKLYASNQLVLFEGQYLILGQKIPLYIYFQPSKLADGSVLLTVSEISAGTLALPRAEILTYIKKNYSLPDFISVDVANSSIHIQTQNISNNLGIYVKANTLDLYNDQIIFDIYRKN
ncbi:membrane protein [Streptococcus varani]|uniref:Membrane protein n=1 Tax=Streptococcus varani TaxID=1608583 RepID=A0A0E4H8C8_9STRE|nr:DUF2140 family protein [Streptococcus varani]CQR25240.1 membrane protein [Streptococcus varani]